ncbi:hypothetical protein PtA15_11A95 [Puccinia triticina]|uniref:Uncharacterized protein n=1 Tax=Puccinia triticina TaxID=208348 RepID=A0ABY7CY89_9BASI|nr:uncharacterized protein PtA15_11A95 [Puccinia triticina]WAQ89407.1 hypothetical protein PtA15_11A95 [Puccinia triticina]
MTKHIGQPVPPPRGLASLADFLGYSKPWSPGSLFRNSASSASTNQISLALNFGLNQALRASPIPVPKPRVTELQTRIMFLHPGALLTCLVLISCSHGRCLRRGLWKRMNDMDQLKVPLLSKDYSSEFARASDAGAYNERTVHRGKGRQHYINEDSDSLDGPPKNSETTKAVPKDQMAGSRPDRDFKNESGGPSGSKIPIVKENKEQEIRVSLPPDSLVRAEGKLTKIKMKVFRIISPRATMKPSWCLNWLFEARKSDKGEDPEFIEPYEFLKSIFEGGLLHDRFF